jgi:tRNA threonylcarbamoyl adenosine modification protein (Sua5/YciO/YrdC/YwlC family)
VNRSLPDEVVEALAAGKVVAVPTDTVYGLAVDPRQPGAVDRLFALKGRPGHVAVPVLIADPAGLAELAESSPATGRLTSRYWPGPLTLVLPRRPGVAFDLGGDPATIGLRCPADALVRGLLARTGPLAVTSANRHGEAPLYTADEVGEHFGAALAAVLDGGRCAGRPSTVVSLIDGELQCLREGALAFSQLVATVAGFSGPPSP